MSESLTDQLASFTELKSSEKTSVGEIMHALEGRSYGTILTLLGLMGLIPVIGGIPGMPIILAALIVGFSIQFLGGGGNRLWLPEKLKSMQIESAKLEKAVSRAIPFTRFLDGFLSRRLTWLTKGKLAKNLIAMTVIILGLSFVPIGFIPMGIAVPSIAILAYGLALIGEDGLFAVFGHAVLGGTLALASRVV